MEIVTFHFVQEEYDDGDVYMPRREITFLHNAEDRGTLQEVLESFKEFLTALGYMPETVARVVFDGEEDDI
jgi:hypothetical protein